jgi:two-component system, chemotaxis family, CheB/CheR fusion protein
MRKKTSKRASSRPKKRAKTRPATRASVSVGRATAIARAIDDGRASQEEGVGADPISQDGEKPPVAKERSGQDLEPEAPGDDDGDERALLGRQLRSRKPLTVVGVGASAGGLETFSEVLRGLTETNGMAFVFVQHLAPKHASVLPDLLASVTTIPVVQITDGMALEPDRIHVVPPNAIVKVADGMLRLAPRDQAEADGRLPIDMFFRSLAEAHHSHAIGVVLSGTGSDGAAGIVEIKAGGGITMAQAPDSAKYDGMPRAAIATGAVDLVRPASSIAEELIHLGRHPYLGRAKVKAAADELRVPEEQLHRIFVHLRNASGIDFSRYKRPTVKRRFRRRMILQKIGAVDDYVRVLGQDAAEAKALARDILINVTSFFRDADSFEVMKATILPEIVSQAEKGATIRIWIPGCSTGEEVYSIAISFLEYLAENSRDARIQIFATDVSDDAVARARAGSYPESIVSDVSPERLRRFFTKTDGGYRINKTVRDMCIFARQDLTRDPPFSKLDLIVCRNVLIYLDRPLQQRLMKVFHYALRARGFLMLSSAETIGMHTDLFTRVDKKHKVYLKRQTQTPMSSELAHTARLSDRVAPPQHSERTGEKVQSEAQQILMSRYTPPGILVDPHDEVVHFHGHTGRYLEPPPGEPSRNIMKMAREGLLQRLRHVLQEARSGKPEGYCLILFEERSPNAEGRDAAMRGKPERASKKAARAESGEEKRLREELRVSSEYLPWITMSRTRRRRIGPANEASCATTGG